MNNQPQRDNSSLWFLLGGFFTVTLVAIFNRLLSRPLAPITPPPQPIHVDIQLPEQTANQQPERVNWDVIGFASAAITLLGAAVFFYSGWTYEAHWFSFYGINISQLTFDPIRMMVQGIPGVLYFVTIFLFSLGVMALLKGLVRSENLRKKDIPYGILLTYFLATSDLFIVIVGAEHPYFSEVKLPLVPEVIFALVPAVIIISYSFLTLIYFLLAKLGLLVPYYAPGLEIGLKFNLRLQRYLGIDFPILSKNAIEKILKKFEEPSARRLERFTFNLIKNISGAWKVWSIILIIIIFLVANAFSALFGEYEARLGQKMLNGNWQISEVFIYSEQELSVLSHLESIANSDTFRYGPLSLITEDNGRLFFVDWKETEYYVQRPNLYMIPYNDKGTEIELLLPSP